MTEINFPPLRKIINEAFIPLWNNRDRYLLLWGGRGSSKSDFTAKKLIFQCLNEKYFRYILIRETYASIKDSQYQTIKDIINQWGLAPLFSFRENPLEIRCANGNIIYARGCDDVEKIKSIKDPSGAWYEEANNISKSDFLTVTTSIRTRKADYLQEILTFNPECEVEADKFWMNEMFGLHKQPEKLFRSHIEITLPSGEVLKTSFTAHHSTYKDNRWCTKEFIAFLEQLLKLDPYYYDVFCLGIWGSRKGDLPFCTQWNPEKHESTDAIFHPSKQIIISVDFNLTPFAVTFHHTWKDGYGDHHWQFDEGEIAKGSIPAMIDFIKDRYFRYLHAAVLSGDAMGNRGDISQRDNASNYKQLLRGLGMAESQLRVKGNPTHKNSKADVNYFLANFPDYKINPKKCPHTCRDARTVQTDNHGEIIKKNRNDPNQRADFLDSGIRYPIFNFHAEWIDQHQKFKR